MKSSHPQVNVRRVCAAVALAFSAGAPFAAYAEAPKVTWKTPITGSTVKGLLNLGTSCYVNGIGVSKVQFYLDSTPLNTDSNMADGMQCVLDTTRFANGTHQLKAVAYNASGASRGDVISINIQ